MSDKDGNRMSNPFVIKSYVSKELFCDREQELEFMLQCCRNETDMTLISQRRMGKTGLIGRLFDELEERQTGIRAIYVDIFAARSLADFIKLLAEATLKAFPRQTSLGMKFFDFIKSLRPQISFDNITGDPQLQISYQSASEKEFTLRGLLEFLDGREERIVVAIDEFQQIREFPEQNVEALLRTYMQAMKSVHFIFCGSKKHLMTDIFANAKKPFYASTTFITLDKIPAESYAPFIKRLFTENGRRIEDEAVAFILEWTRRHTYYTQHLCHMIYAEGKQEIGMAEAKASCEMLMKLYEPVYLQYRQMITENQWNYLIAVAKEGSVTQVTANSFLSKYDIGTPSVSRRLVQSLCEKDLLAEHVGKNATSYQVSDVFMSHWLERL